MDNETYRAELFHEPAPNNVNMPWTIERQFGSVCYASGCD